MDIEKVWQKRINGDINFERHLPVIVVVSVNDETFFFRKIK